MTNAERLQNTNPIMRDGRVKPNTTRSWVHLLAGASAGTATAIVTSPLDVLRTRLQSDFYHQPHNRSHGSGTVFSRLLQSSLYHVRDTASTMYSIYRTEHWRGFFRGIGPSLAGVVPATAVKFYVYGSCKQAGAAILGLEEDAALVHAQAAIAAGIATATATNPIWLVKTRMQLQTSRIGSHSPTTRQYKNSLDCARQILQHEGIRGLYKGLSASYLGTVETMLHLVLYEQLKGIYSRELGRSNNSSSPRWKELQHWISTSGAAGSAKLAAVLVTYPHEVIRTRLRQAPMENGQAKYTGLIHCFRSIAHHEGWVGLYGGFIPHVLRSIPSAVITLGVYEFVLRWVGRSRTISST
ncbi:mitochondrial carrier domain-containing protein [Nemania sp. FL0916]|nr:mitochondrial carrier domain-containing protein [Nemania sp. FL0916]